MRMFSSGCIFFTVLMVFSVKSADAHCEIPCGIYGDEMRFSMIEENIKTVEKSMQMITELSKDAGKNYHQLVRWITNKEEHADQIQEIVSRYFLTQRIKIADGKDRVTYDKYVTQITLLHQMLVSAMKSKQSVDLINIEELRRLLREFESVYFGHEHK